MNPLELQFLAVVSRNGQSLTMSDPRPVASRSSAIGTPQTSAETRVARVDAAAADADASRRAS
jgi:hypothetical protein